jgi:hypothetical protein
MDPAHLSTNRLLLSIAISKKRAEPVSCAANGVKCHVSCDMAVMELKGPVRLFKNPRKPAIAFISLRRREWN